MPVRRSLALRTISLVACTMGTAAPVAATVQFQKVFTEEYLNEHADRQFVEYVRHEAKCNACHQGTKDRKNHNAYGEALAERLDAKADAKSLERILAALREVERLPADPRQPASPTFGDRLAAGKLPAGELEAAKREPSE
jgi:hypothetical protein